MREYELTEHARLVVKRRKIDKEWLGRALNHFDRVERDSDDPTLSHYLVKIFERDNRVLRVVVNDHNEPNKIVTAFFDRNMRGKL